MQKSRIAVVIISILLLLSLASVQAADLSPQMKQAQEALAKHAVGKTEPMSIAMRVNKKADTCEGVVLGFDWNRAYTDTGVTAEEHSPQGGQSNPMFWISRVRMSRNLAEMPKEKLLGYIVELKRFSGKAAVADKVAAGDPYLIASQQ